MAPNMKTEVGEVPRPKARKWPDPARVTSCFRTGGSVPVPKTQIVIPVYTVQRKEPQQHQAKEENSPAIEQESCSAMAPFCPLLERLEEVEEEKGWSLQAVVSWVDTQLCEPPPPPPREQRCRKHTRCHCDDFSFDTPDFFSVVKV